MQYALLVAAGGALGSLARYGLARALGAPGHGAWPWATFLVNGFGGLIMGFVVGLVSARSLDEGWRVFLVVGVLGGFTTFSAFAFEVQELMRVRAYAGAFGYAVGSVLTAVGGVFVGLALARRVLV